MVVLVVLLLQCALNEQYGVRGRGSSNRDLDERSPPRHTPSRVAKGRRTVTRDNAQHVDAVCGGRAAQTEEQGEEGAHPFLPLRK